MTWHLRSCTGVLSGAHRRRDVECVLLTSTWARWVKHAVGISFLRGSKDGGLKQDVIS